MAVVGVGGVRSVTGKMLTMWHWEGEKRERGFRVEVEEGRVDGREGK